MVVTANGIVTRVIASDISRQGRPATGVKVQSLDGNDYVVSVNKVINTDEDEENKDSLVKEAKEELDSIEQGNIFDSDN